MRTRLFSQVFFRVYIAKDKLGRGRADTGQRHHKVLREPTTGLYLLYSFSRSFVKYLILIWELSREELK